MINPKNQKLGDVAIEGFQGSSDFECRRYAVKKLKQKLDS